MEAFVRVVEDGGFSAAARSLTMTPSAISKLITRLEARLGARLLHRTTRRINLTHEGAAFYQRSKRILTDIDDAEEAISLAHGAPRGLLTITTSTPFAHCQIVPILPEFFSLYPEISVDLAVTDRVVDMVEGGYDIALRINARKDSTLIVRQLATDRRIICASSGYLGRNGMPTVPADLRRHNCLAWTSNHADLNQWPFNGPEGPTTVRVSGNTAMDNGETLYEAVRAGIGIARLAGFRVGADIQAGRLVPLLTDFDISEPFPIDAVYTHRRHLLPKVRAFVDFLVRRFTPAPPWRIDPSPPTLP
jgi:DNA-binding transcriptional LysR family regulator